MDESYMDRIGQLDMHPKKARKKLFTNRRKKRDVEMQMQFMSGTGQSSSHLPQPSPPQQSPATMLHSLSVSSGLGNGGMGSSYSDAVSYQEAGKLALIREQGFSSGLAKALAWNANMFSNRYWIVDNSGSMEVGDGHRITVGSGGKTVCQQVTRWQEIQETVQYHCEMASLLASPTHFCLLNPPDHGIPQAFAVATSNNPSQTQVQLQNARNIMAMAKPTGVTPLTHHIYHVQNIISDKSEQLRRDGQRVVLVLATDGLPSDEEGYGGEQVDAEFVQALRSLEGLPVWVVIRLCTDEDKVCEFYNSLDKDLGISLEVLDDFFGEAREVKKHNPWLNYSMGLHRSRELGYHHRIFDFLDERPLTKGELQDFAGILLGMEKCNIPDPVVEWKEFLKFLQQRLALEDDRYNPIRKRKAPLMDLRLMHKIYGKGGKLNMMRGRW